MTLYFQARPTEHHIKCTLYTMHLYNALTEILLWELTRKHRGQKLQSGLHFFYWAVQGSAGNIPLSYSFHTVGNVVEEQLHHVQLSTGPCCHPVRALITRNKLLEWAEQFGQQLNWHHHRPGEIKKIKVVFPKQIHTLFLSWTRTPCVIEEQLHRIA